MSEQETTRQEIATGTDDDIKESVGWRILREMNYFREEQRMVNNRLHEDINNLRGDITSLQQDQRADREHFRTAINNFDTKIDNSFRYLDSKIDGVFKSLDDKIERLRDSFQARFDKLTYWATGIIVTILLAAGYIGHR